MGSFLPKVKCSGGNTVPFRRVVDVGISTQSSTGAGRLSVNIRRRGLITRKKLTVVGSCLQQSVHSGRPTGGENEIASDS